MTDLIQICYLQACNSYAVTYVPLYDTLGLCFRAFLNVLAFYYFKHFPKELGTQNSLSTISYTHPVSQVENDFRLALCVTGPNAVEFIINHAEVSIAFVHENKIPSVSSISSLCLHYIVALI